MTYNNENESEAPILLVDIDHTISDAQWRDGMMAGQSVDWDAYHEAGKHDNPVVAMRQLINDLYARDWFIIALTARPEKWRHATNEWLLKHDFKISDLIMREDGDFRRTNELKVAMIKEYLSEAEIARVHFIIDDHDGVIEAFKGIGIHALRIHAVSAGAPQP